MAAVERPRPQPDPQLPTRHSDCAHTALAQTYLHLSDPTHADGTCPGNYESAGKRKSGRARKGSRWLRATLIECARGAVLARDSYLAPQYHRVARRRGDKKAIATVAHSILVAAWHILRHGVRYHDLGHDHFDRLDRDRPIRYHTRRLADLGVRLPAPAPASSAA